MTELETRQIEIRAQLDTDKREITGLGVPYGEIINVYGMREMLAPGSVRAEGAKLFYSHREPIGRVRSAKDDATGWHPTATISKTARGDEVYELLRDGTLDGLSIGFQPVKWRMERDDEGEYIVYDEVLVREVSVCAFPFYPSARVKDVRSTDNTEDKPSDRKANNMDEEQRAAELKEIRESLEDVQRNIAVIHDRGAGSAEPKHDTRSAGEVLKAIVSGDENTIREYNALMERAYAGGTTADAAIKDTWVGDLTRIYDASTGILVDTFATGTLPDTGMNVEFAELDTNSIEVKKQTAEGADLKVGKVSLKTRTAPVNTYGGATRLTLQEIQRSQLPILDRNLEALAMAAGVRHKLEMRAAYNGLVAERVTANDTVDISVTVANATAEHWLDAVVDAALKFEERNAPLERLLVSSDIFKRLVKLTTTGHRVFRVDGDSRTVGELDLTALRGDLASLPVYLDSGSAAGKATFVNGRALRSYLSPVASLQDENVINLSKEFSVYRFGAIAAEIPGFVVPVKFGA